MGRGREDGFSLIEVLIAMAIFAIGALGALTLVLDVMSINANSAQTDEAKEIANWMLEQVQVRAATDAAITSDGSEVWVGGAYGGGAITLKSSSSTTIGIPDIATGTSVSQPSARYQMKWISDTNTGVGASVRHWRIRVAWPRARDKRGLRQTDAGFVDCFPTAGSVDQTKCMMAEFHSYRKVS